MSRHLAYAARRDDTPVTVSEFAGATVDVAHITYAPTGRGTPRWIATADFPGFHGIQIELFQEHIDLVNRVQGLTIGPDFDGDVDFQAVVGRWSARRGFTGFGAVWQDFEPVWLHGRGSGASPPNGAAARNAERSPDSRPCPVADGAVSGAIPYRANERAIIKAVRELCQQPRYRWYIHSLRESSALSLLAGHPMTLRITTQPGHSGALALYAIPPFDPAQFRAAVEALAGAAIQVVFVWHRCHQEGE